MDTNDVEIIDICERNSKEFELCAENFIQHNNVNATITVTDLFDTDVPESVLWPSILTVLEEAKDFQDLTVLCQEFKRHLPPLKKWNRASFSAYLDRIDKVAQSEIPTDGPIHLKAVCTHGEGNRVILSFESCLFQHWCFSHTDMCMYCH